MNNKKHRNGGQVSGCKESNENMNDKMNGKGNVREPWNVGKTLKLDFIITFWCDIEK